MTPNEYQKLAMRTNIYKNAWAGAMGFLSEAGEVAGVISKVDRDDGGKWSESKLLKLFDEIGDCLWGIAFLAEEYGTDLESLMERNIAKLADRYERGVIGGSGDER